MLESSKQLLARLKAEATIGKPIAVQTCNATIRLQDVEIDGELIFGVVMLADAWPSFPTSPDKADRPPRIWVGRIEAVLGFWTP